MFKEQILGGSRHVILSERDAERSIVSIVFAAVFLPSQNDSHGFPPGPEARVA